MSEATRASCACCAPTDMNGDSDATTVSAAGEGVQQVRITVKGGYSPRTVSLTRGVPARLVFDRQEASGCSAELLIPGFGIRRKLPQYQETVVEFIPTEAGSFDFTCGMQMLRGEIVVAPAQGS